MQKYAIFDYETFSEADIKKSGSFEYCQDPSTQVLCASWRVGTLENLRTRPIRKWSPWIKETRKYDDELFDILTDEDVIVVAHNALFEQLVTEIVLPRLKRFRNLKKIKIARWICTAAQASAQALPRKLVDACLALGLKVQKDMEGHRLMLKMSKPRKPTKNNPSRRHLKKKDLLRLMDYCATDVDAETELFLSTPQLQGEEREIWELDQKINRRGFACDRELVLKVLSMIKEEIKALDAETERITKGALATTRKVAALKSWLDAAGVKLENMQAKTIEDALNNAALTNATARRLLRIRQAVSKTSTGKYVAFELRSRFDGRIRDHLMYHGSSTGRWSGKGVQPQNFPQGRSVKDPLLAVEFLRQCSLEELRDFFREPMELFSACLRPMITASNGKKLFDGDYAQIEARIVFWLAGQEDGVEAFRKGLPIYEDMATDIHKRKITKEDKAERDIGKRAVLGCGFGMGWKKFLETCEKYGQPITEALAKRAVKAYREKYSAVPQFWKELEHAAIRTVQTKKPHAVGKLTWKIIGDFLVCVLPSGRPLWYYKPEVKTKMTPWGEPAPVLYHWDIHPKTKKWVFNGTYGGKLAENAVQGTARDIMAGSMLRADKKGFEVLMSIHDENLSQDEDRDLNEYFAIMEEVPKWAKGLPIKVDGWKNERYFK